MYLTHEEYKELGFSKVSESEFSKLEIEARSLIRYRTMNRSDHNLDTHKQEISECMCLLVDNLKERDKALNELEQGISISRKGIASESVTDHSFSFSKVSEQEVDNTKTSFDKENINIIRRCLMWTGLLYRGI